MFLQNTSIAELAINEFPTSSVTTTTEATFIINLVNRRRNIKAVARINTIKIKRNTY